MADAIGLYNKSGHPDNLLRSLQPLYVSLNMLVAYHITRFEIRKNQFLKSQSLLKRFRHRGDNTRAPGHVSNKAAR